MNEANRISKDTIYRQAAIDAIHSYILSFTAIDRNYYEGLKDAKMLLHSIPSAQPDIARDIATIIENE